MKRNSRPIALYLVAIAALLAAAPLFAAGDEWNVNDAKALKAKPVEWSETHVRRVLRAFAYGGLASECVILGPGSIEQAHSDEEWVAVSELEKLAGMYARWWGLDG